jgi:hypothetical protein
MCAHGAHIPGEGVTADRVNLIPSPGSRASARSDLSLWALWEVRMRRGRITINMVEICSSPSAFGLATTLTKR